MGVTDMRSTLFQAVTALSLFGAVAAQARVSMVCTNRGSFEGSVSFSFDTKKAELQRGKDICKMSRIDYKPISSKYEGWIRFGAGNSKACERVGTDLFNNGGNDSVDIHWMSVSREVQKGKDGFTQVGFQNIWDGGAGSTAKVFLRCYPKRR
jgi:hypothetical protein